MKHTMTFLILSLFSMVCAAEHYGATLSDAQAISVSQAIDLARNAEEVQVMVEAEVTSVCQAKGCWMGFDSDAGRVRVTFKDYGFFVPFSIVGKTARVEGTLKLVELGISDSKHLVEDAGGDPDTITEPVVEFQLVATGVEVKS